MGDGAPAIAVSAGFTDYGDYLGVALSRPLLAAGAVPLLLPYLEDAVSRAAALDRADALLLGFGRDIAPERYGARPHPAMTDSRRTATPSSSRSPRRRSRGTSPCWASAAACRSSTSPAAGRCTATAASTRPAPRSTPAATGSAGTASAGRRSARDRPSSTRGTRSASRPARCCTPRWATRRSSTPTTTRPSTGSGRASRRWRGRRTGSSRRSSCPRRRSARRAVGAAGGVARGRGRARAVRAVRQRGAPPSARDSSAAASSSAGSTSRRRAAVRRAAGPWRLTTAASSPLRSKTGAASALRSGSRSRSASAQPRWRTPSISRASAAGSVIVRSVKRVSSPSGGVAGGVGEHDLADRGGVADARAAEPRHGDDARARRDEVDGHRLRRAGNRQRRRLVGPGDELAQQRACQLAGVEPGEHAVGERDEPQPQPVGAAGAALDEAPALERGEQPRGGRGVDPDAPRELVDAESVRALGERVEERHGPRHGRDGPAPRALGVVAHGAQVRRRAARASTRRAAE